MTHDSKELRPTVTDTQQSLTPEMVRLVLAARHVAFVDQEFESLHELDEASEAFAKVVPWDDDPNDEVDALPAASPAEAGSPAPYVDPDLDKAGNRKYWSERNACESATPPKSAPDAMREALEPFFTYLKQVRDRFPESSSDTIIIGGPYNLTYAHFEKLAAAFSAPVPPPDGAAEAPRCVCCGKPAIGKCEGLPPPSGDVRSALAPFAEAADGAASVRYSDEFVIWQKLTVGHLRTAKAALRSVPVSAPATGSWQAEREVVARAIFGDGWKCCTNLGPYVQGVVKELNELRKLLAMMPPDLVEHHRDLIEQTSAGPLKDAPQVPQGAGIGANDLEHTPRQPLPAPAVGVTRDAIELILEKTAREKSGLYLSPVCKSAMVDAILAPRSPAPDATVSEPVEWQKRPKFGDTRVWTSFNDPTPAPEDLEFWCDQNYEIRPLYISPQHVGREAVIEECAKIADGGAKDCCDGHTEWHKGFRYAADATALGIASAIRSLTGAKP